MKYTQTRDILLIVLFTCLCFLVYTYKTLNHSLLFFTSMGVLLINTLLLFIINHNEYSDYGASYDTSVIHPGENQPYIKNGKVDTGKLFGKGAMNLKIQEENLLILHKFFKKYKLEYFIDCGTLLGAIRENGLIKGDQDADFSISKNSLEKLRDNLPELEKLGFVSFRNSDSWMAMSLLRRGEYVDVYKHKQTHINKSIHI